MDGIYIVRPHLVGYGFDVATKFFIKEEAEKYANKEVKSINVDFVRIYSFIPNYTNGQLVLANTYDITQK